MILCAIWMMAAAPRASAQWATFDASNLAQAVLSFLQDGDNMVLNTEQFLENLGVAKEQLEFLQEADKRYKEVRSDIYKAQSVIRIAKNYEMIARMFTRYVETLKSLPRSEAGPGVPGPQVSGERGGAVEGPAGMRQASLQGQRRYVLSYQGLLRGHRRRYPDGRSRSEPGRNIQDKVLGL